MFEPWSYSLTHNIEAMSLRVQVMRDVLSAIDGEIIGSGKFTTADLTIYCKSLIKGQRSSLGRTKAGSWSVAPDDEGMPAEVRVDFIFAPTYIAVATLCRVLLDYPWIAIQVPGYYQVLRRGLNFCADRQLEGSGYEAIQGMLDAFLILAIGKVPVLLERAPSLSPKLATIIKQLEKHLQESLLKGVVVGQWGEDLTSGYQAALETLYLYQDKELVESVGENRSRQTAGLAKKLPW